MEILIEHLIKGIIASLIITMPVVMVAAGIGLVIGILQAVTQVQEQTIVAAPKILGVFLVIIALGSFFTKILTDYTIESINLAFFVIPKQNQYLLPPDDGSQNNSDFFAEEQKKFASGKKPDINKLMNTPGKIPFVDKKKAPTLTKTPQIPNTHPNLVEKKKLYSGK